VSQRRGRCNSYCAPDEHHEGIGAYFGAGLGWIFHPSYPKSGVELGPVLRLDIAEEYPNVTLNFALGFASVR
jgi:hypothetical protein